MHICTSIEPGLHGSPCVPLIFEQAHCLTIYCLLSAALMEANKDIPSIPWNWRYLKQTLVFGFAEHTPSTRARLWYRSSGFKRTWSAYSDKEENLHSKWQLETKRYCYVSTKFKYDPRTGNDIDVGEIEEPWRVDHSRVRRSSVISITTQVVYSHKTIIAHKQM
jgi:hypothetical protein